MPYTKKINLQDYFKIFIQGFHAIKAWQRNKELEINIAIKKTLEEILKRKGTKNKIVIIGNGASAALASHMAVDLTKNLKIQALSLNDPVLLTCMGNDFGYPLIFKKPLEVFIEKGDLLIAISASGCSKNILEAARIAKRRSATVISFSGFSKNNPLIKIGQINFYIPLNSYGLVEAMHTLLCHFIVDKATGLTKNLNYGQLPY